MKALLLITLLFLSPPTLAKSIRTNGITMEKAPYWLKRVRVDKVTNRMQSKLEWTIRRIKVHWHSDPKSFQRAHSLGEGPSAVSIKNKSSQSIHLGPEINSTNFDEIFAHELVHIIFFQKYYGSIPRWLEEGFANHLSRRKKVNYQWLAQQKLPVDVQTMTHPYKESSTSVKVHYTASQALVEMLDKKCDLENLIRLSVERKMEDYIKSYCEIKDINKAFKQWIAEKTKSKKS